MHPVLIFRHAAAEGPGYFATFLDRHAIPWRMVRIDADDPVPENLNGVSGVCLMGGPMSVNDDLPWIEPVLRLIRAAVANEVPVIGHCLGGQLMAKALGGKVGANPVQEIGWGDVEVVEREAAEPWLGHADTRFLAFHWHGETFGLPRGAVRLLASAYCANQAFVLADRHLAMQCHVEMTPELVETWCANGAAEIANAQSPAVQPVEAMLAHLPERTAALHRLADKIYSRWIQGLRK